MPLPSRKPRPSQLLETLISVLPTGPTRTLPPEDELLTRTMRENASERFFRRNFAQCDLSVNLYDRFGERQIEPFLPAEAAFPTHLLMPHDAAAGCAFVFAERTLYFLYDRIEHWENAPGHLAFVAVRIDPAELIALASDAPPGLQLAPSEYHLLAQLLCGLDLKSAAAALGAAYDTKRKQIRVVLDKFGAKTQTALLRSLTMELTAKLLDALLPSAQHMPESVLVKRQFGGDVVTSTISVGNGSDLPVWEFGARNGRPVLYFHTMLSPVVFCDDMVEALRRYNLRWIVVPRHFLSHDMPFDTDMRMAHLTRALGATLSYLTEGPLVCLGESMGVSWAAHFARHNPGLVEHLLLAATPTPGPDHDTDRRMTIYGEISARLRRDRRVNAGIARIYNALARVPALAEKGLMHLYRHSPPDLAMVEALCEQEHFFEWLQLIATVASHSSMDELQGMQRNWPADLHALDCPMSFIHGADDPISPPDGVEAMIKDLPQAEFMCVEDAGHFVVSQHFAALAAHTADLPRRPLM